VVKPAGRTISRAGRVGEKGRKRDSKMKTERGRGITCPSLRGPGQALLRKPTGGEKLRDPILIVGIDGPIGRCLA